MVSLSIVAFLSLASTSPPPQNLAQSGSLSFIGNEGQWDSQARFKASVPGLDMWVTDSGLTLDFNHTTSDQRRGHVVQVQFSGEAPGESVGYGSLPSQVRYLNGDNASSVVAPAFKEAWVKGVGSGLDARYYFDRGVPRYDLVVRPGTDPRSVRMSLAGASNVRVGTDGRLRYDTSLGTVVEQGLFAYQKSGTSISKVDAVPVVANDGTVSFRTGAYDPSKPLIIDPTIAPPVTIGSMTGGVLGSAAADSDGSTVVVGTTISSTFPTTPGAYDTTFDGIDGTTGNGYVSRIDNDGNVIWTTYFGKNLSILDVAFDSAHQPVIVGRAFRHSIRPPLGAYDSEFNGDIDGFAAKLSADGSSMIWSTFIGGFTDDEVLSVAVSPTDVIYLAGYGGSDYPVTAGSFDTEYNFNIDAVLSALSADGTTLLASTFIGSPQEDRINDVKIDSSGNVVVGGRTSRRWFPLSTSGVLDTTYAGGTEGFVAKFTPNLDTLAWSTFVGGDATDSVRSLAIGSEDSVIVGGTTSSATGFTGLSGVLNGTSDAFVLKLDSNGAAASSPATGVYVGGNGAETLGSVSIAPNGSIVLVGGTNSTASLNSLTTPDGVYPGRTSGDTETMHDSYITQVSPDATTAQYGSFLGIQGDDEGTSAGLHGSTVHVYGHITSEGVKNVVVSKVSFEAKLAELSLNATEIVGTPGPQGQLTATVQLDSAAESDVQVTLASSNPAATVPATVTIPQGSNLATFAIDTLATTSSSAGEISASLGDVNLSTSITVNPVGTGISLEQTSLIANSGRKVPAKILLSQAVNHDVIVDLSSDQTRAAVPATVTVPAGQTEKAFTVTSGVAVFDPVTATITGTYGTAQSTATLTLLPPDLASVSVAPDTLKGWERALVTVTFNNPVPADGQLLPRKVIWAADGKIVGGKVAGYSGTNLVPAGATSFTFELVGKPTAKDNVICAQVGSVVSNPITVLRPRVESISLSAPTGPGPRSCNATVALDSVAPIGGMIVYLNKTLGQIVTLPATSVTVTEGMRRVSFTFDIQAVGQDKEGYIMARSSTSDEFTTAPLSVKAPTIKEVVVGSNGAKPGATFNMRITITSKARIGGLKIGLSEEGTSYLTLPIDPDRGTPGIEIDGDTVSKTFQVTLAADAPVGTVIHGKATLNGQEVPFVVNVYP